MLEVVTAGAIAGLISAPHCALMCGPLGVHASRCGSGGFARYQVARSISYAGLGIGAGILGEPLISALWSSGATLALSIGLALLMVVAAVRIWPRQAAKAEASTTAQGLIPLRPRKSLFGRILRRLPKSPGLIGACSALLPCGALWSGVALAVASGSPSSGAALMVAFSLTSGIGVLASSQLVARTRGGAQATPLRARILSAILVVGAVVLVWRPLAMQDSFRNLQPGSVEDGTAGHSCPLHAGGSQ